MLRKLLIELTAFATLFLCNFAFANSNNCTNEFKHRLYPSINGMKLGENSINDFLKKFGKSPEFIYESDVADFNIVCYSSSNKSIVLYEWKGNNKVTDMILAKNYDALKLDVKLRCKEISKNKKELTIDSGIDIGMHRNEVVSILGQPVKDINKLELYDINDNRDVFIYFCDKEFGIIKSFDYVVDYIDGEVVRIMVSTLFFE